MITLHFNPFCYSVIPETQPTTFNNNNQQRTSVRRKAEPHSPDSSTTDESFQVHEKPQIKRRKYSQREHCIPGKTLPTSLQRKHLPGPVESSGSSFQTKPNEKDVPVHAQPLLPEPVEGYGSSSESESNEKDEESDVDVTGISDMSGQTSSRKTSSSEACSENPQKLRNSHESDDEEDIISKITNKAIQPLSEISSISSDSNGNEVPTVTER